ncbi:MAG: 50S ribosomal protein L19 [Halobacteriovoraceae bacterium]|nr:50S ribosomal protein L19 [Halobacteriovoraceae bacterium]
MNLVDRVNQDHANNNVEKIPHFKSGDTIAVHAKIKEGNKVRIQIFQGICIAIKDRNNMGGHYCVRKISGGIGVERVFPFHSPNVEKIVVKARGKTRRAKLYYLRKRSGKSAHVAIDYDRKI